jgi:Spy/CpxP family protein refolding chaperone
MGLRQHRDAIVRGLLRSLLLAACGPLAIAASAQGYRWWQDAAVQRELSLTAAQVTALEGLFASTLGERRTLRRELDRLDARVQRLLARADADDQEALEVIAAVEAARAKRNVARTLMLFRMYRMLSSDQRKALQRLQQAQPSLLQPPARDAPAPTGAPAGPRG